VLPECLCDDDSEIRVERISWTDTAILLQLTVLADDSRWRLTCQGPSAWRFQGRIAEGLAVTDDDPILWQTQFAIHTTYFSGKPADPGRAACDLLSPMPREVGVLRWSPNALADLLATGNGSLGSLPVPAIRLCKPILTAHGIELYYLGNDESETTVIRSALVFGTGSYVIAERFNAERQS